MKGKPAALPEGAEVHVRHFRAVTQAVTGQGGVKAKRFVVRYYRSDPNFTPDPCGGKTEVDLVLDGMVYRGVANCSIRDAYCYQLGRQIALGRALKDAEAAGVLQ